MAADVTELAVGGAREDFAAVTIEELDDVSGFGFHDSISLLSELCGKERRLEDSREEELRSEGELWKECVPSALEG